MWPRTVEFMLACFLAISPFIFRYPPDEPFFLWNDLITSFFIAIFSLMSYVKKLKRLHLGNLGVALYLILLCYLLKGHPLEAALQNYMVLGLLILMTAIIPSDAHLPPRKWRDYYSE